MTDLWLGYAENAGRREVLMALRRIAPGSAVVFVQSPWELRERLRDEEPRTVGAIVGHGGSGVSDLNLAAAVAHDGFASEVVLVARGASGSLRSRASQAGITRVVDATVAPGLQTSEQPAMAAVGDGMEAMQTAASVPVGAPALAGGPALPGGPALGGGPALSAASAIPVASPNPTAELVAEPPITVVEQPPEQGQVAPILTVTSGRGGVGKTSLVAMMAACAARWGMDVALVDLDLSCGNLYTCFGVTAGPDLARIVADGGVTAESMGRASVRCAEHLHLWGPCARPEMAEVVMPHMASLLSYLSSRHDLVLVDTSTTFTDAVAQAVQSCDRMLVVHDERAGAIASAARMSALAVRLGVARTRIVRVVNLGDPRAKPNAFEGRAEVGLETARMFRVVDGGIEAEELLASGKVCNLVASDDDVVMGVSSLLAQTLAELGRLPDDEGARKAAERRVGKRRKQLFGKHREVA